VAQSRLNIELTMSKTADRGKPGEDWDRFDAMSATAHRAAALADPDAKPLASEDIKRMRRTPQIKIIRRALGLSQEEFSARFHIPVGTLRDWEQGRKEPDAAGRAYLMVIGRNPSAVAEALSAKMGD
jgi:putative transcriptional regulator